MPPNDSNFRPSQPVRPTSAQRRAAEQTAVAGKQARLKAEAAERAAARAQRDSEAANAR